MDAALADARLKISIDFVEAALVSFDYFLTLPHEVQHVWSVRMSPVSLFFLGLRYSTLALVFFSCLFDVPENASQKSCSSIYYAMQTMSVFGSLCISGVFTLRAAAIWRNNKVVMGVLALIALSKVTAGGVQGFGYSYAGVKDRVSNGSACWMYTSPGYGQLTTIDSALIILYDTSALLVTVARMLQSVIERRRLHLPGGYAIIILRHGFLYYLAIDVLVIATVVISRMPSESTLTTILANIEHPLSAIIAQRFVLSIRHEFYLEDHANSTGRSSLLFASRQEFDTSVDVPLTVFRD